MFAKLSPTHFTRQRKLPFPRLIVFLLSIVSCGKGKGVDIKAEEFFKNARRSELWPEAETIHRSALSKARKKVPWKTFEDLFYDSIDLAGDFWPKSEEHTWKGMSVYAIDGSKMDLPTAVSYTHLTLPTNREV